MSWKFKQESVIFFFFEIENFHLNDFVAVKELGAVKFDDKTAPELLPQRFLKKELRVGLVKVELFCEFLAKLFFEVLCEAVEFQFVMDQQIDVRVLDGDQTLSPDEKKRQ